MTCREFIEFIEDYRSGKLPEAQRQAFDLHMGKCPSCVCYLDGYEKTILLGKKSLCEGDDRIPDEVPAELIEAILAARKKGE